MGLGAAGTAAVTAAGVSAAGGIGSSLISGGSAKAASQQSAALQQQAQLWAQQNQQPFISTGQQMNQQLAGEIQGGALGQPFNPTMAQLKATPGYQFTLQQALQQAQNAYSAQGLGVSGAATKGAENYAAGLASQTYQQQFNNYWANQNNRYSMLAGLSTLGANTAVQAGTQQIGAAQNIGATQAAGTTALGNQLGNALQTATSYPILANALQQSGLFGTGGSATTSSTNALNAGGSPAAFQAAYGLASNQYVP